MSFWSSAADRALPLRLTLLVLVLRPPGDGSLKAATWLVAGAALVFPALTVSAGIWSALAVLVGARIVYDWPLADNHIYLLTYWCLAVALALWSEGESFEILRRSSGWLIGFAFLCAVVWKALLSPDYLDGRFFRVTLSTDDRFAPIARAAGLTDDQIAANREALEPLPAGAEALNGPVLTEPPMLRRVAALLTWGGLALELLVGIHDAEHRSDRRRRRRLRHLLRSAKLHRGAGRIHHRTIAISHGPDQGRSTRCDGRLAKRRSDHRGVPPAPRLRDGAVWEEPSRRSRRVRRHEPWLRRVLREPLSPERRRRAGERRLSKGSGVS